MTKQNIRAGLGRLVSRGFQRFWGMTHGTQKKVVFSSFHSTQYSDSPRAICETMHRLYPDYELVWLLEHPIHDDGLIPDYVRVVYKNARRFGFGRETSTCAAYVVSCEMNETLHRRRDQFFVQTWHGDRAFKRILYDVREDGTRDRPVADEWLTTLCVAASDFGERMYRTAFHYPGEVLRVGMPRNDALVRPELVQTAPIRQRLGVPEGAKVLLYAPTFRDNKRKDQAVNVDLPQVLAALEAKGERWVCIIRAHAAANRLDFTCDGKRFIDATAYPDMTDLLAIGDMLITDYSSCAGDFILTGKPVLLACFDQEEYKANCRAFYVPIEETGFLMARDQAELMQMVRTNTAEDYAKSCERVRAFYGISETGHAAETVCRRIDEFYRAHHKG